MEPQENDQFDVSKVPDIRSEWTGAVSKEIWGPAEASSTGSDFSAFRVHSGVQFIAGEGSMVKADNQQKPDPPQEYQTRIKTTYLKAGPLFIPLEKEVKTPIEREWRPPLNSASVEARNGSKVLAESAHVSARMGSFVQAGRNSGVQAFEGSTVRAQEGSHVDAHNGSRVLAEGGSFVTAHSGGRVVALDGSRVVSEPGSEIEAREGSTVIVSRPLNDSSTTDGRIIRADKGTSMEISDASAVIDPSTLADLRFTGNQQEWEQFRTKNPNLKIAHPDYTSFADIIGGNTPAIKKAQAEKDNLPITPSLFRTTEPPSPAPAGSYDRLERNLRRIQELRERKPF